jgi:hypothetical protein
VRGRAWPLALLALAFVFAYPMQVNGWNQNAHYALVRALADGKPWIDETIREIGDLGTGDVAEYGGHVYAAKAPGLAFVSLPAFLVVEATGMRTTGDPTRPIWALHLWGVALAAVLTLVVVRRLGDRIEPGLGVAAAVIAGLGTLLLPFATLYFSHVLSGLLGLAAFAVLWREREGRERLGLLAAGGALAGFAVAVEYPLVFVAAILGLYAIAHSGWPRRALAYGVGALAGVAPLLAFNQWAFGSPTHVAYEDYYAGGQAAEGVFGFGAPSLDHARDLLLSSMGLLTLTPVVACGVAGAVLLLRRRRAEALVVLGVAATYYLYNTSLRYASPFGGLGPPRYLFPLVPFLAVPLALVVRRFPLTTLALGLVSAFQMVVTTATGPLAAYDGDWLGRLGRRDVVQTAASFVDVTGWYTILPFFGAAAVAAAAGVVSARTAGVARADLPVALLALLGWAVIATTAGNPNGAPPSDAYVLALVAAAGGLVAVAAAAAGGAGRGLPWRPRAAGPLLKRLR